MQYIEDNNPSWITVGPKPGVVHLKWCHSWLNDGRRMQYMPPMIYKSFRDYWAEGTMAAYIIRARS